MKFRLKKSYRGLTLIEVLVALFVFAIMMVAVSGVFAKAFSGYRSTRATQRDVENAQYALNLITKELRTSTVVAPTTGPYPFTSSYVKFYDHSQGRCFYYRINASTLQVASNSATSVSNCRTMNLATFSTISTGTVSGSFRVTPSQGGLSKRIGKVTIALRISEDATHYANMQTTASLRDFGETGLVQ
jgi:prepilin-type N-terminal cleavage/methylation domain-containing protein